MSANSFLKDANISVHVIATGAGAGIQQQLWAVPGCSAYLSGASFPYATEETEELLGFRPKSFCSEDAAIDLASAAYMKAFHLGKKSPVGIGVTATVASATAHRGDNRFHICVMTNDSVRMLSHTLVKGVGEEARAADGMIVDNTTHLVLLDSIHNKTAAWATDVSDRALSRFMERPFFTSSGKRLESLSDPTKYGIMSGAFNPPHEGHFEVAESFSSKAPRKVVFEVTANPPHKSALTVQELLQRAKMLQGHNRLFTSSLPLYLDKARKYPGAAIIMGADAALRMLDPKWGVDVESLLSEFITLGTKFYIMGRMVGDKFTTVRDIMATFAGNDKLLLCGDTLFYHLRGRVDMSSTELRNKSNG